MRTNTICGVAACLLLLSSTVAQSQTIQYPSQSGSSQYLAQNPVTPAPTTVPGFTPAPSTTLGQPFDPYSTTQGAASSPPTLTAPGGTAVPYSSTSPATVPQGSVPDYTVPGYSLQPPVLFPNGTGVQQTPWPQTEPGPYLRVFQDLRMRYAITAGKPRVDDMQTHDFEFATTINFPNFLWSGQPLHVSPAFILHLWSGPVNTITAPGVPTNDLPSQAYSGFVDFGWQPRITPMLGGEINFRTGLFSDFNEFNDDSWRFIGRGLLVAQLTPTMAVKAGIEYLDRVNIKMLPAGGILWTPNPHTRFDIYFPQPKLAQYLTTVGNTDVWWYLMAEYGYGSWTIDRPNLTGDKRMDINDYRVGGGLEWIGPRGLRSFLEGAYVFNRKIVYAGGGTGIIDLRDAVMVRGGLSY